MFVANNTELHYQLAATDDGLWSTRLLARVKSFNGISRVTEINVRGYGKLSFFVCASIQQLFILQSQDETNIRFKGERALSAIQRFAR
jgi:hypothetical protein